MTSVKPATEPPRATTSQEENLRGRSADAEDTHTPGSRVEELLMDFKNEILKEMKNIRAQVTQNAVRIDYTMSYLNIE